MNHQETSDDCHWKPALPSWAGLEGNQYFVGAVWGQLLMKHPTTPKMIGLLYPVGQNADGTERPLGRYKNKAFSSIFNAKNDRNQHQDTESILPDITFLTRSRDEWSSAPGWTATNFHEWVLPPVKVWCWICQQAWPHSLYLHGIAVFSLTCPS